MQNREMCFRHAVVLQYKDLVGAYVEQGCMTRALFIRVFFASIFIQSYFAHTKPKSKNLKHPPLYFCKVCAGLIP
jgi:hypothetical protein